MQENCLMFNLDWIVFYFYYFFLKKKGEEFKHLTECSKPPSIKHYTCPPPSLPLPSLLSRSQVTRHSSILESNNITRHTNIYFSPLLRTSPHLITHHHNHPSSPPETESTNAALISYPFCSPLLLDPKSPLDHHPSKYYLFQTLIFLSQNIHRYHISQKPYSPPIRSKVFIFFLC